ncbi:GLPGLI family protein [uncultured Winogradskyella sp.]|uniref:GLPGLI family protein n=1 Tax=uncultured Winogradskyella sp. TaxID=395353 RepID=UPI002614D7E0|nr:GLPGLI family protein [uncultured Winogradskyella sp.]
MTRYFLLCVLILSCFVSLAQKDNLEVEYSIDVVDESDMFGTIIFYKGILKSDNIKSEFKLTTKDTLIDSELFGLFENHSPSFQKLFYKDLGNSVINYKETRGLKNAKIVKDKSKITWTLSEETKIIDGSKCNKASCEFRGRKYEVYYDKDIDFKDGPFKFSGLPGLIIEVNSLDGAVKMKANLITYTLEEVPINPYEGLVDIISFSDYKKQYVKHFKKMTGYRSDIDSEVFIPKRYIEYLVE